MSLKISFVFRNKILFEVNLKGIIKLWIKLGTCQTSKLVIFKPFVILLHCFHPFNAQTTTSLQHKMHMGDLPDPQQGKAAVRQNRDFVYRVSQKTASFIFFIDLYLIP